MIKVKPSDGFGTLVERDVTEEFQILVQNQPSFLSAIGWADYFAKAPKHEWLNDNNTPTVWTVDTQSALGTATVAFVSTDGLHVGDRLRFEAANGAPNTVQVAIDQINSTTHVATVTRLGTDAAIPATATAHLVSRAKNTGSTFNTGDNRKPSDDWNQTQIEREDVELYRTDLQTALYGLSTLADQENKVMSLIDYQVKHRLIDLYRRYNDSFIYGIRTLRGTGGDAGHAGGILDFFGRHASARLSASNSAISDVIINNAAEKAGANGANLGGMTVLLAHPSQARKISGLYSGSMIWNREDRVRGTSATHFQTDLFGTNGGGGEFTIFTDRNFPRNQVAILDPSRLSIVPMQPIELKDANVPGKDGFAWYLLGELTLEMKNAADGHMLITDLTL